MGLNRSMYHSLMQIALKTALVECGQEMSWSKGELSSLLVLSDKVGTLLEGNPTGDFKSKSITT